MSVKHIMIPVSKREYDILVRIKGERTWYEFLVKPVLDEIVQKVLEEYKGEAK